jgi:hypothetical protein
MKLIGSKQLVLHSPSSLFYPHILWSLTLFWHLLCSNKFSVPKYLATILFTILHMHAKRQGLTPQT